MSPIFSSVQATPCGEEGKRPSTWPRYIKYATQCGVSAASFFAVCACSRQIQKQFGISCASSISKLCGLATLCTAGNVAAATVFFHDKLFWYKGHNNIKPIDSINGVKLYCKSKQEKFKEVYHEYIHEAPIEKANQQNISWYSMIKKSYVRESLMHMLIFFLLGGHLFRLSPSHLAAPGAFAQPNMSLQATMNYATEEERRFIRKLGQIFGCHSCGARNTVKEWIADHQPPKLLVTNYSQTWGGWVYGVLKRMVGSTKYLPQRFYPQCKGCSQKQATLLRKNTTGLALRKHLILRHKSFRLYLFTGGIVQLIRIIDRF